MNFFSLWRKTLRIVRQRWLMCEHNFSLSLSFIVFLCLCVCVCVMFISCAIFISCPKIFARLISFHNVLMSFGNEVKHWTQPQFHKKCRKHYRKMEIKMKMKVLDRNCWGRVFKIVLLHIYNKAHKWKNGAHNDFWRHNCLLENGMFAGGQNDKMLHTTLALEARSLNICACIA